MKEEDASHQGRRMSKARSEVNLRKLKHKDVLPARLEKQIYELAETSSKMHKMSIELDTHQKCVTNLAATVVSLRYSLIEKAVFEGSAK